MKAKQTQKVGSVLGKARVCLWNRKIETLVGFTIGQPINIKRNPKSVVITAGNGDSTRKVSRVKNKGNVLPVIDLKGPIVEGLGSHVDVTFSPGLIEIRPAS